MLDCLSRQKVVSSKLSSVQLEGALISISSLRSYFDRHSLHCKELFYEYSAYCKANGCPEASYNFFMTVINKILGPGRRSNHLGIRKSSQHAKCNLCFELKRQIRIAKNGNVRTGLYRKLSKHLLSQWLDRQHYWSLRSMSRAFFQGLQVSERTCMADVVFAVSQFSNSWPISRYLVSL